MIVTDASVINKLFLEETDRDKAKRLVINHTAGKEAIIVPDLLFYEVINTLAGKTLVPQARLDNQLPKLFALNLQIFHLSKKEFIEAARLARKYKVTVYDAVYAVLAKEKKCDLVTADEKFVEQVKLPFVKSLTRYKQT